MVQFVLLLAAGLLHCFLGHHPDEIPRHFEDGKGKQSLSRLLHEFEQALGRAAQSKRYPNSTIAEVFRTGYLELGKINRTSKGTPRILWNDSGHSESSRRCSDNVERALHRACSTESSKLESLLGFLATTSSACPFIGLFGTRLGHHERLPRHRLRASATLAVVAPGISEALVATAFGLAAAIPAVAFYNYRLPQSHPGTSPWRWIIFASEFLRSSRGITCRNKPWHGSDETTTRNTSRSQRST